MGVRDKVSPVTIAIVSIFFTIVFAPFAVGVAIGVVAGNSCQSQTQVAPPGAAGSPAEKYLSQFTEVEQVEKRQLVTLIVQIGLQRQLSVHSIEVAVATGIQESNLTNLGDLGEKNDHDSLGVFQQRPSQGWGTKEEILNPPYAVNAFYDKLETVSDRDERSLMDVAIEVQNPSREAYQKRWAWDEVAKELVSGAATPEAVSQCINKGWQLPLAEGSYTLADPYGMRVHPKFRIPLFHSGVDLSAPDGTPIYACTAGTVEFIGDNGGLGNYVKVGHAGGIQTGYAHMSSFAAGLKKGDSVQAGQVIGYVGTTGTSTGNHLHFMVMIDGSPVNPTEFLESVGLTFS